jgi:hypothetical protein
LRREKEAADGIRRGEEEVENGGELWWVFSGWTTIDF